MVVGGSINFLCRSRTRTLFELFYLVLSLFSPFRTGDEWGVQRYLLFSIKGCRDRPPHVYIGWFEPSSTPVFSLFWLRIPPRAWFVHVSGAHFLGCLSMPMLNFRWGETQPSTNPVRLNKKSIRPTWDMSGQDLSALPFLLIFIAQRINACVNHGHTQIDWTQLL